MSVAKPFIDFGGDVRKDGKANLVGKLRRGSPARSLRSRARSTDAPPSPAESAARDSRARRCPRTSRSPEASLLLPRGARYGRSVGRGTRPRRAAPRRRPRPPAAGNSEPPCAAAHDARNRPPADTASLAQPCRLPFYRDRASAAPANTATRQSRLLAIRFAPASSQLLCSNSANVSNAKLENVVYEPQKPMATSNRHRGSSSMRSELRIRKKPR